MENRQVIVTPNDLSQELGISAKTLRAWLRRAYPRASFEHGMSWRLTFDQIGRIRDYFRNGARDATVTTDLVATKPTTGSRANSDEAYVIDLCDEILGERARRQHRFPWLFGDAGKKGRKSQLPVDAYYERQHLVIEYHERQHDDAVPFFNRRQTVSGMGRADQRRRYDARREIEIPKRGLQLIVIKAGQLDAGRHQRLRRNRQADLAIIRTVLVDIERCNTSN